jgi:hypothetical protein
MDAVSHNDKLVTGTVNHVNIITMFIHRKKLIFYCILIFYSTKNGTQELMLQVFCHFSYIQPFLL